VKILVLGSSGQLARHLRELAPGAVVWGRDKLDLGFPDRVEDAVIAAQPAAIINAAAYTAVDKAEEEADLAWRINAEAPAALARASSRLNVPLVHISTDYVFDGRSNLPYTESDPVQPLNVYGRSKLGGELAVAALGRQYYVLRTSWVFSEHGHNFVKTMLRLAAKRPELTVVDDQFGRPTYAGRVATVALQLAQVAPASTGIGSGVYHLGAGPAVTWRDFAEHIVEDARALGLLAVRPTVRGISTLAYARSLEAPPAPRPRRSVLQPSPAISKLQGSADWPDDLRTCLRMIAAVGG
jgi:dTDP-4-dehydrorhamnose reductase